MQQANSDLHHWDGWGKTTSHVDGDDSAVPLFLLKLVEADQSG